MANYILVTCGTSQLENLEKCANCANSDRKSFSQHYHNAKNRVIYLFKCTFSDDTWAQVQNDNNIQKLIDYLTNNVDVYSRYPGGDNYPYGAEISTLRLMKEENVISPENDYIEILYSNTPEGIVCAVILRGLVIGILGLSIEKVYMTRIAGFREDYEADVNPGVIVAADNTFAVKLGNSLQEAKKKGHTPLIVYTGGFKSMIPILSFHAMAREIQMVYMYIKSKSLHILNTKEDAIVLTVIKSGTSQSSSHRRI